MSPKTSASSYRTLRRKVTLQLISVDWNSRKHHEAFAASADYKPWLERLDKAIDTSKAAFHHVDFQPLNELSKVASAPVTEISTFFFGDGAPGAEWLGDAAKSAELMGKEDQASSGVVGLAYGITHEELSRDGVNGKAAVVMIGWESEAARAAFRETQTFKEVFGLLKGEAKAIEVLPVAFGTGVE